jgi:hypothetical protein
MIHIENLSDYKNTSALSHAPQDFCTLWKMFEVYIWKKFTHFVVTLDFSELDARDSSSFALKKLYEKHVILKWNIVI